ncbi:hypothetical protein CcaverHIS002_0410360 [Cutaneotrichosporon cavernicola]|uniref:Serum paraoxonase/arylesterase 2 n=1 Tax=Cutaneotrichosporon cavernicola TaxID=279322 RepID=A0AA48QWC5_9TREE|nr:uncharacterized protein CcaverHIS019_0410260 [Cutaneotrichosporon cavernicola]BEI84432.1 hypothetical protein CcaverHIS002_0410360 [Cutaneotrichosporon cavernicola]BEI92206.1 hypothetical protein CcaverHIS019_0410260 [Cutaneotrichosporon cavernicola]BEI99977.1 hypothetical protein CcaverHIS631_0410200 [Cutaneotrichosporon cavernicola]BEJ07750.1 hypothetical protein CcaverHIS641_0410190 [Cutaneotrichosporon cavernicola]
MPSLITFAISLAAVTLLFKTLYDRGVTLGAFRDPGAIFHNAGFGDLRFIDGADCEDLHLHEGHIFTACQGAHGSRGKWFPPLAVFDDPSTAGDGELRVINPETFISRKLNLDGFSSFFCTHGIDVIEDPQNSRAVYIQAVNHAPTDEFVKSRDTSLPAEEKADSRIEIFHHVLGSDTATHVRTVRNDLVKMPNDLLATGPTSFFVTNDHFYREGLMRTVEVLGTRATTAWSNTVHVIANAKEKDFDGVDAVYALNGLHNNNGLGRRPGGLTVVDASGGVAYLAHIEGRNIKVDGQVVYESTIDNPSWFTDKYPGDDDRSGLLQAGLAKAIQLHDSVLVDAAVPPIVWLSSGSLEKGWNTTMLFTDDGLSLSSSSAAVMISIDPATNDDKKQAWLFMSGFGSTRVVATKVDL